MSASSDWMPGRSASWKCHGHVAVQEAAGEVVLVAVAVQHAVDARPLGRGPRATSPSDGSITTDSFAPRTTSELPCGYFPRRSP